MASTPLSAISTSSPGCARRAATPTRSAWSRASSMTSSVGRRRWTTRSLPGTPSCGLGGPYKHESIAAGGARVLARRVDDPGRQVAVVLAKIPVGLVHAPAELELELHGLESPSNRQAGLQQRVLG